MCKKYSGNNVYVLEIHSCQYYIGCHTQNKEMYESGILKGSGNYLRVALLNDFITLQEYKDCCKIIAIEEYDTPEEAQNREAELIEIFKNKYGSSCLNISKGNKYRNLGLSYSEEHKRKIAKALTGQIISEETKKKISEANKGKPSPMKGHHHTEESKRKMSEAKRGTIPVNRKAIQQFTLDGQFIAEYPSISEASRQTGIRLGNIGSCLIGRRKSAGNSLWKYAQVS